MEHICSGNNKLSLHQEYEIKNSAVSRLGWVSFVNMIISRRLEKIRSLFLVIGEDRIIELLGSRNTYLLSRILHNLYLILLWQASNK